jgi:hypothetical protein
MNGISFRISGADIWDAAARMRLAATPAEVCWPVIAVPQKSLE